MEGEAKIRIGLRYAGMGYGVLPLAPGSKAPNARLVPKGLKEASRDPERIRYWWGKEPRSGVGLLPPEGVLVLDADGEEALEKLLAEVPGLEEAPRQRSPRGGGHVFVRIPGELSRRLPAAAGGLGPSLDIRGLGRSYVAAWPTEIGGAGYRWEVPLVPVEELPWAPKALLERLWELVERRSIPALQEPLRPSDPVEEKRLRGMLRWAAERVASAPVGTRHRTLLSMARLMGGYCHLGLSPEEVVLELARAGERAGLPPKEALSTALDGVGYGLRAPLPLPDRPLGRRESPAHPKGCAGLKRA